MVDNPIHHDSLPSPEKSTRPNMHFGTTFGSREVTNAEIESYGALVRMRTGELVQLDEKAIKQRSGANSRYVVGEKEDEFSLALSAINKAFDGKKMDPDFTFVSMSHPVGLDSYGRDPALRIQNELGISGGRLNIHAACSGFGVALNFLHRNKEYFWGKKILFVAAEKYSPYLVDLSKKDGTQIDPGLSQILLTDAAAAGVIDEYGKGMEVLYSQDEQFPDADENCITMAIDRKKIVGPNFSVYIPPSESGMFMQKGQEVYDLMKVNIPRMIREGISRVGLSPSDIRAIVPHQGSGKMCEAIAQYLNSPLLTLEFAEDGTIKRDLSQKHIKQQRATYSPVIMDLSRGNLSSGAAVNTIKDASQAGLIKKGDIIAVPVFGAGPYAVMNILRV